MSAPLTTPRPTAEPPLDLQSIVDEGRAALHQFPSFLVRLLTAVVIVAAGVFAVKLTRKLVRHIFKSRQLKHFSRDEKQSKTVESLTASLLDCLLFAGIATSALSVLGVDVSSLLAIAGIGGVALGFGAQALVKDFISGMFLWAEERVKVGDTVTIAGQTGTVESVALRTTVLRGVNGFQYVIPNGDIRTVVNMSREYRCAIVDLTILHGQDYRRAIAVLAEAMEKLAKTLSLDHAPTVPGLIASDFRAATVRIECKCDVSIVWSLEREIRLAALEAFCAAGIKT